MRIFENSEARMTWTDAIDSSATIKRSIANVSAVVLVSLLACDDGGDRPALQAEAPVAVRVPEPAILPLRERDRPREDWTTHHDFDGDARPDRVIVELTGGGHCCYRISVELTSQGSTVRIPFEMDGGYPQGLDLSNPSHFDVIEHATHASALRMEIATYNGVPQPLPTEWQRDFGIRTHHVEVSFVGGKMRARDVAPRAL